MKAKGPVAAAIATASMAATLSRIDPRMGKKHVLDFLAALDDANQHHATPSAETTEFVAAARAAVAGKG